MSGKINANIVDLDLKQSSDSALNKNGDGDDVELYHQQTGDHEEHRMLIYDPIEGVPLGLEPLLEVTSLYFTTGLPLPVSFDVMINRHYNIMNQVGQKIFHAGEKTNLLVDYCCNGHRPLHLYFFNGRGKAVITATQKCSSQLALGCGECNGIDLQVTLIGGETLGTVRQKCTCWWPLYEILDQRGQAIMTVEGPGGGVWTQLCGRKFKIAFSNMTYGKHIQTVAMIDKRTMEMPEDLSVQNKALLLGALFVIELSYYQSSRTYAKVLTVLACLCVGILIWQLLF